MPGPKRQLSAAELAALEHAFAADPISDAFRPLTEAYLVSGRFMEAMVVCKKGVKAHPGDPSARVLLARVYADQGKDRKALEELQPVLAAYANYAAGHLMAGQLQLRLGQKAEGEAALRRAAEAAPADPEVQAALEKHGLLVAPPALAPEPPRAASARGDIPVLTRGAPAARAAGPASPSAEAIRAADQAPIPTPPPRRAAGEAYAAALAQKYATSTYEIVPGQPRKKKGVRAAILGTVGLAVVLAVSLGGWAWFSKAKREQDEAIVKLLRETQELISRDTAGGYRSAAEKAKEILKLDPDSLAGHAFLAYVDALRFGEHAEGETVKAEAMRHVDAARKLDRHSHLIAAEAYLRAASGDAPAALAELKKELEDPARQTALLSGTLGVLLMNSGDLDASREWLARAQKLNSNDVRIAQQLAEQYRRRGEGYEQQAEAVYQLALRLQKDHVPSLLGRALLLLDRGLYEQAAQAVRQALAGGDASTRQLALGSAIRASIAYAQGKTEDGAAEEKKALELDPQSPDLPWLIGRRQLRDGDAAAAVVSIQRAVNGDGKRVAFYVDLTQALLATEGGAQKAVDLLQKATSRAGESPRIALLLGDAYRALGDADRARGQYERAVDVAKKGGGLFPDGRVALARLLRDQKNVPQALAALDQAITEYGQGSPGGAAAAYVEMAETERSRGAKPEAIFPLYVKALEKDPARCEALWGAGKLGYDAAKGLDESSQPRLERYVQLCPRGTQVEAARRMLAGAKK